MEGDAERTMEEVAVTSISIHSLRMEGDTVPIFEGLRHNISIHSLRMEGDMATSYVPSGTSLFQSTPSAWRETCHSSLDFKACVFQSTPSAWRETIRLYLTVHMESVFQSTPSAWRETYRKSLPVDNIEISIHSLRMEGDLFIRN